MSALIDVLNSTSFTAVVTVGGGIATTYIVYVTSKKKDRISIFKRTRKNSKQKQAAEDRLTYAGYERLIKEQSVIIDRQSKIIERMTDVDTDRDKLIDALRQKEVALYKIIEEKDLMIGKLRREINGV